MTSRLDAALEQVERAADEAHRYTTTRRWLSYRLGEGPWTQAEVTRELALLDLVVRAQREAGVPTLLDRPPAEEPERRCDHCDAAIAPEISPNARYCSRKCGTRAASIRWREKHYPRART